MELLKLYKKWMQTGEINSNGLCNSIPDKYYELLNLFEPSVKEKVELNKHHKTTAYWGYDGSLDIPEKIRMYEFTPLRQTIVCFIMAMENEI